MTSTVRIEAHCGDDKEVHVTVSDGNDEQVHVVEDGESFETYIYAEMEINVKEVNRNE